MGTAGPNALPTPPRSMACAPVVHLALSMIEQEGYADAPRAPIPTAMGSAKFLCDRVDNRSSTPRLLKDVSLAHMDANLAHLLLFAVNAHYKGSTYLQQPASQSVGMESSLETRPVMTATIFRRMVAPPTARLRQAPPVLGPSQPDALSHSQFAEMG